MTYFVSGGTLNLNVVWRHIIRYILYAKTIEHSVYLLSMFASKLFM